MIGQIISHYKITEKLGEGGMGVVYKARDLKLERYVALKFLSPGLGSGDDAKKRFIQEAKAASALDHINICTIYEIDEIKSGPEEARLFISMAYYEGETLATKIKDEIRREDGSAYQRRLKIKEVIDLAIQIAQGLARAHESNIIHRDIKPANIMITPRGEIKILDFGLAKLSDHTRLTKDATTLGTVAYMSPEQIKGDHVDHRTDLWSLGVIMYEMMAGISPFKGEYEQSLMYTIVNEEPEPLADLQPDTPKELAEIVNKAMRKNPTDRYQNLDQLVFALKQLRLDDMSEVSPPEKLSITPLGKLILNKYIYYPIGIISIILIIYGLKSLLEEKNEEADQITAEKFIAVLPFESITKAEEDRIFSEGIFEDIITQLVKIKDFKIIDRRSVGRYRNSSQNYKQIGEELGVGFILTGSIRKFGDKIRINARLIEANSEDIVWADSYDQEYYDIFTIQKDVAQKLASALKVILTPEELDILDSNPTENREAYEYYQKGNYYWYNYASKETNFKAFEMYEKASELDSNFVLAFAMQAYVSIGLYMERDDYSEERLKKAKTALDRAIKIAPDLPEVHMTLGRYYENIEHNYDKALAEYEEALQEQPNNVDILDDLGTFYLREGNPKKAADYFIKSYKINPFGLWSGLWVSNCYNRLRNWNEAEKWVNIYISKHPDNLWGYIRKCQIFLYGTGNLEAATRVIEEGMQHTNWRFVLERVMIKLYARRYEEALKLLDSDGSTYYDFYMLNYDLQKAMIYMMSGELGNSEKLFGSAKIIYENLIKEEPDRAIYHSNLGLTLAGLGNKTIAIQLGKKAVGMLPIKSNPYLITEQMNLNLVYIYIMSGEMEEAINQIDFLLSIPCHLTVWRLRLDPIYDPLRDNPAFQRLLAKVE